ncbi:TrkA family potassium uptake protein [Roseovarius sp. SCSIO 43702]|uniref:potassium channel family protein n=1 Tax=Roseovarius sp. SCSIO 43702 TaxID=2823043 RepID=UPI001C737C69|nr:TrkA family potassium uptake protein [Roseovarius sp. SCSIO 43702]QYX56065.1 TrkA family potassium uptake protein [Roseovarius sp. SCSIO 43702]
MARKKGRSFAIIGLGTFGTAVGRELARFGNYVLGIDTDPAAVNHLAETLSQTVVADGRDEDALKEVGIGDYDVALIAMGEHLESSIVTAITLKMSGVPEVWAKAVSRTHHRILSKLGVDRVVNPEEEMGRHIAQMLHTPLVRDYLSLGNGYHVVNIVVPERLAGKTVGDLDLGETFDLRCMAVMDGSTHKGTGDDLRLAEGDRFVLLGARDNLRRFTDTV